MRPALFFMPCFKSLRFARWKGESTVLAYYEASLACDKSAIALRLGTLSGRTHQPTWPAIASCVVLVVEESLQVCYKIRQR